VKRERKDEVNMGHCAEHPERETSYQCTKHGIFMCEECMTCRDPDIYCKYRTSCPIHFMEKKDIDGDLEPPVKKARS